MEEVQAAPPPDDEREGAFPEFGVIEEVTDEGRGLTRLFAPSCSGTTGPYRRVFSLPGYAYMFARVYLPGSPDIFENRSTKDTAFVYAGGWGGPRSAGGNPGSGDALDAGFQHSPTLDNWALFAVAESTAYVAEPVRFRADQEVDLWFFVSQDNQVTVIAQGEGLDRTSITKTIVLNLRPNSGWRLSGEGIILKRMTSIGQKPQGFNTGSFIRGVRWHDCAIGRSKQDARTWAAEATGGYCSFPGSEVHVQYESPAEEADSIIL